MSLDSSQPKLQKQLNLHVLKQYSFVFSGQKVNFSQIGHPVWYYVFSRLRLNEYSFSDSSCLQISH